MTGLNVSVQMWLEVRHNADIRNRYIPRVNQGRCAEIIPMINRAESDVRGGRVYTLPAYLIDHNSGAYASTRITSPGTIYPRRSATSNVVSRIDRAYVAKAVGNYCHKLTAEEVQEHADIVKQDAEEIISASMVLFDF